MDITQSLPQNILSILSAGPATGYAITRHLYRLSADPLPRGEGTIYPVLHAMEQQNLIRAHIGDTSQGTERRFYRLTGKGRRSIKNRTPLRLEDIPIQPLSDKLDLSIRIIRLRRWSMDAVMGITVSPDREIVAQELYDHLYDKFSELVLQGMSLDDAEKAACDAMGSYRELARELSALHTPFWTRSLRFSRYVIAVLSFITLICYGFHFLDVNFLRNTIVEFETDRPPLIGGTHQLLWEDTPLALETSDGYTVRAYRTALWETTSLDDETRIILNIQLRTYNPIPWAEEPDFADFIWAQDSLGNIYLSAARDTPAHEPALQVTQYHTGRTTYVQDIWIFQYVSQDAEWLELHYDRSGRDMVLRIDLPGGD